MDLDAYITDVRARYPHLDRDDALEIHHSIKNIIEDTIEDTEVIENVIEEARLEIVENILFRYLDSIEFFDIDGDTIPNFIENGQIEELTDEQNETLRAMYIEANNLINEYVDRIVENPQGGFGSTWKTKRIKGTLVRYTKSTRPNKKWMTIGPNGRKIHWGHPTMKDYTQHHDKKRRRSFRARMSGIRKKDGRRAIDVKWSPAWLAHYVTW